ncbi:two-component regulator propeller domain-containing protein [Flavobacterium sp. RHBU_3]|uniref:type IX secretion system anionic LPS delivery protein PorZ n=1 Tax=Flavobacterium sp. RHBU_3 TaxID=3391184 RepID=UPI0039852895
MNIRHTFLLLFICCFGFAQNQQWGSYFSYTGVVDMAQNNSRVYSASESAVFSQNVISGELKTLTSVDGLKAETITSVYYSSSTQRFLVGNSNGLLFVVNQDGSIVTKIDIVQETNVLTNVKNINNIYEYNGMAYLSCGFGIVVFNLETLQFGDTYYIGSTGGQIGVNQCAVHNGYIFAATQEGLKRAPLTANLINFSEWSVVSSGIWRKVLPYEGVLFAVSDWNTVYTVNGGNTTTVFTTLPTQITDFREANGYMVITCATKVLLYDSTLTSIAQINTVGETATFIKATYVSRKIYVGTTEKGVYSIDINTFTPLNITPNGPLRSNIFSLEKTPLGLWAVYGKYNFFYTPDNAMYGASKYTTSGGWDNIAYDDLTNVNGTQVQLRSLTDIAYNPNDEKQVYLFSAGDGVLRLNDMVPQVLYNPTNSSLLSLQTPGYETYYNVRVRGGVFDSSGKLWMMNSRNLSPLKVYTGSSWNSYSFENIVSDPKTEEYGDVVVDRNGTKWIGCYKSGLVAYNETMGPKFIKISTDNNMPDNYVRSLAQDNSGRLWIGTNNGLRVLYTTEGFLTEESLDVSSVIFEEDGVAQELMYGQAILDIKVDGADNKWFATAAAGAYLVSSDGQRTLYHFTKENSPLPSNNVNDITIDNTTGEVFFATDKGMVSYKGTSTEGADDLSKVYVYPNPVRPGFDGDVKIANLTDNANVKITDIEGNLVYEATSEGGTILWDTTAFGKYKVRSGVYMVFISTEDASATAVRKVMVIRGN